jgi:glycosyltransferase involved in cell wall biosynthesis
MPQRVLLISNMYPSAGDPAYGSFVQRCVTALSDAGIRVERVVMQRHRSLWVRLLAYFRMWAVAHARLLLQRHDCIYIHHPLHSLAVCVPGLFFTRARLVLNFHGHDLVPITQRGRLLQRVLRPLFRRAWAVVLPSAHFKAIYEQGFAVPPTQRVSTFASGGVADSYLDGPPPLPPAARLPSALFLSRWEAGKGWDVFLEVAHSLSSEFPAFSFTVAGTGKDRKAIEDRIDALGLRRSVSVVESAGAHSNRALYRQHRYFVMPSQLDESLALVNLEAMVSGCIALSSRFEAATEYIESGVNGHLLERCVFAAACVSAIRQLEGDPAAAFAVSAAGMRSAAAYRESHLMRGLPALLGLDAGAVA